MRETSPPVALAASALLLVASTGHAASGTAPVHVTIVQPVQVSTTQPMEFGTIVPPPGGVQTFRLDVLSNTVVPGEGGGAADGEALLAEFTVTGEPQRALDVQAAVTQDFSDPALSLGELSVAGSDAFDAAGHAVVRIGGTLTVAADAAPAHHGDAVITVTVNYQ